MIPLKITREILPNGARLVTIDLPGRRSLTSFLAIRSGSRYETTDNSGIAHFLEHLVFKGTKKYPTNAAVAGAIESIGGTLNAWTDFDHTAYWNIVPARSWRVGVEIPFELAFEPLIRQKDIERERGVITEEIRMLQDDPAGYVRDLATELVYGQHPLSRPIIGTEATVAAMTAEQFNDYRRRFYVAPHAVFVVAGDLSNAEVVGWAREKLSAVATGGLIAPEPYTVSSSHQIKLLTKPTDQTHFVVSTADPLFGLHSDQDRFVADVLNTILGRGMSSRLFLNVREKRGLAYSISSHIHTLEDGGALSIYGGVNTQKATEALAAVRDELQVLCDAPVSASELRDAQNFITGANDMRADRGMALATWYGTDWLLGRWETHDDVSKAINAVTAEDIRRVARQIFDPARLVIAAIGPQTDESIFAEALLKQ